MFISRLSLCLTCTWTFLPQMQFMLLFSRQGKLRLQKWYVPLSDKERKKISRDLVQTILARKPKMCSFLEWRDLKIVYKRWVNKGSVNTGCDTTSVPHFLFLRWHLQYESLFYAQIPLAYKRFFFKNSKLLLSSCLSWVITATFYLLVKTVQCG